MRHERVFSKEVAAQVRRIELRTRGLVESLFSGEYRSVFKGRGMEFSDVREYQPGDDVRAIDWNVTARRGRPFVKEHIEERELTALLIVDLSASKDFGTGTKTNAVIASEIAAILALAATNNNDRVGLLLVTDRVELFVPPDSGRRHALRLVLDILSFRPAGRGTKLSQALEYAARVLHRRTAVFLISDFMMDDESDPVFVHDARRFSREHDLVPIRLSDPGTATLPDVGLLSLADPETGLRHIVNTGDERVRRQYAERRAAKRSAMDTLFRELRLDVIEVSSAEDYVLPLIVFFRRRERVTR
ncbi:MAG: DUF58 domain-containing protein [Gemmatimonadota bacterium]|nr:DUF58 domain-containing protein [Gemmatimonadota bacterium]HAC07835.1 DUF58 domain-containing protein [Gemmatimonadota bacterium]HIC52383.1 DUF58 domain-containing protein [Gemmatimonadota bacterium]